MLSSNMLYPKEDRLNNTLMFACRTCQFSEPAASSCVFRNNLYNTVGETAGVTQDVAADPTVRLPDFYTCTLCGQEIICTICVEEYCSGFVAKAKNVNEEARANHMETQHGEVVEVERGCNAIAVNGEIKYS